jgi:hypothetical protein
MAEGVGDHNLKAVTLNFSGILNLKVIRYPEAARV